MTFKLCHSPKAVEPVSKTACIALTANCLANAQVGFLMGLLMVQHMLARQRIKKQKQNKEKMYGNLKCLWYLPGVSVQQPGHGLITLDHLTAIKVLKPQCRSPVMLQVK